MNACLTLSKLVAFLDDITMTGGQLLYNEPNTKTYAARCVNGAQIEPHITLRAIYLILDIKIANILRAESYLRPEDVV